MVLFQRYELPIAYSMIAAARRVHPRRDGRHPFEKYSLLWIAFNNIYTTIAFREGLCARIKESDDGTIETIANGNVNIPKVIIVREREQIHLAIEEFDDELKHNLIIHESTSFFVNRIPSWHGKQIEYDAFEQRVNGVINVNYTISTDYPVWSPIDFKIYDGYMTNPNDENGRDFLAKQIIDLLYSVRNNLMHGGKRFDDANDIKVVENALPLLELIVASFTL